MVRATLCIAVASFLWLEPSTTEACGIKLTVKAPRVSRTLVASARSAAPRLRSTQVAVRKLIRTGPSDEEVRQPTRTGGGETAPTPAPTPTPAATPTPEPTPAPTPAPTPTPEPATPEPAAPVSEAPTKGGGKLHKEYFFGNASAKLNNKQKAQLKQTAKWLQANASVSITVEGHANATGPADVNSAVSEGRANAVKDFLVSQGVDDSRISAAGLSVDKPEYQPASNPRNRRCIIILN